MNLPGWLGLLLGFVLPLVAFITVFVWFPQKPKLLLLVTAAGAVITSLTLVVIIFSSQYLHEGSQIVWTGVSASDIPLVIGGKPDENVIRWPNLAAGPRIKMAPEGDQQKLRLEIENGGGFVFDEEGKRFLNGNQLVVGSVTPFGDYKIRVNRLGLSFRHPWANLSPEIEVLDASGKSVAGFSPRKQEKLTRSLRFLISGTPMEELTEAANESERERVIFDRDNLEAWASSVWLLRTEDDQLYVLSQKDSSVVDINTPARLTVTWPNLKLPMRLTVARSSEGKKETQLEFSSPWRSSSPFPPDQLGGCNPPATAKPNEVLLTITDHPRPCEASFVLPLGGDVGGLNQVVSLSKSSHKFVSPGATDNEIPLDCPPGVLCERATVGTSQLKVSQGPFSYGFATVTDLPSRSGILALLIMCWIIFSAGLVLAFPRMPGTTRAVVYGIALVVWELLSFRLLLAFRYALDPAALDKLAIDGVGRAFLGLSIIPGFLLLMARLRCDRYERPIATDSSRRAILRALIYVGTLVVGAVSSLKFPAHLWSNLPPSYYSSWANDFSGTGIGLLSFFVVVILIIALHIRFLYEPDESQTLVALFVSPWYWIENYSNNSPEFWANHLTRPLGRFLGYFLGGLGFLGSYILLFWLCRRFLPGDKTAQELFVPTFFLWLVVLWLGLQHFFKGLQPSKYQFFALASSSIIMLGVPPILLPSAIADFGSIIPVVAIIVPLLWLLILTLPLKARLCIVLTAVIIFIGGLTLYQNLEGIIPFQKQVLSHLPPSIARVIPGTASEGRMFARLLNYKRGSSALRWAATANSVVGGEGLPYQELLNGNEHTWENKAMAHLGKSWGLGFGEAPTRRSQVRQDTLQYDSVFSFFIASEYGMVGSVLLLFVYTIPLALVYISGRKRFDAGHGVAYVVASAFLIEALYHVGMNLGAFPLTGRNLPFLSVNSPSDLLKWTALFALLVVAIFWRYEGRGKIRDEATSLTQVETDQTSNQISHNSARAHWSKLRSLLLYTLIFVTAPLIMVSSVFFTGWGVLTDPSNELTRYNYKAMLKDVKWYLDYNVIEFDRDAKRLVLHPERLQDPDVRTFIQQEVTRFNARGEIEKKEESTKEFIAQINETLGQASSLQAYNDAFHRLSLAAPQQLRRSIFSVKIQWDEDENEKSIEIQPNSAFNINFSFADNLSASSLPKVGYANELLIGPAWVNGAYRTVINEPAKLPWASYLRDAVQHEWKRFENQGDLNRAPTLYGTLTLDPALHESALEFTAEKGLKLHEQRLSGVVRRFEGQPEYLGKLPDRVALAIVSLPHGETLALGGWPRMTSSRHSWQLTSVVDNGTDKPFWIPSLDWLENEAPQAFRVRYAGDRNFDRSLVMGSSTKPLWALAVLKRFPQLDEQLLVRGLGGAESSAFGIVIPGKEWKLNSPSDDWVDFRSYLKQSDNRYQIRLGLLGLAESEGSVVKAAAKSPSQDEALNGKQTPWEQYPAFTSPVQVLSDHGKLEMRPFQPESSANAFSRQTTITLADTELAKTLRGMFSVNIRAASDTPGMPRTSARESSYRRSFWTKDENDDLFRADNVTDIFDNISPQVPDFAFDRLTRPRDFVTMLLGGGNNLWANVDLAAAFGSCVTGRTVLAHIVQNNEPVRELEGRKLLDPKLSYKLHGALSAVAEESGGTAFKALQPDQALAFLKSAGVKIYAKTGTLKAEEGEVATSRIILALVKWKDEQAGQVETGLVFSLVAEQSNTGTAAEWLREFIVRNQTEISRLMARH